MKSERSRQIVSFLPSATEMIYALGLGDQLLGVTHECDWPPEAQRKPVVVRATLPVETMTPEEIDRVVSEEMRDGGSLYRVDEALLRTLAPDLIVTQSLCQVCAPSGNEVTRVLASLPNAPEILYLTPHSLAEIFDNLRTLGAATGRSRDADRLVGEAKARIDAVAAAAARAQTHPRVFCMEWIDPVFCSGHWVPEMVRLAGGIDAIGREGTDSVRVAWREVLDFAPEVIVVMPCGFHLRDAERQAHELFAREGFAELPAVRNGRVFAVDASAYFARPGPRVVDGAELLAHLIHPEIFVWTGATDAFYRVDSVRGEAPKLATVS